jgi:hypothetical protein
MGYCQQPFLRGGSLRPAIRRRPVRVSRSRRPAGLAEATGEGGNVRHLPAPKHSLCLPLLGPPSILTTASVPVLRSLPAKRDSSGDCRTPPEHRRRCPSPPPGRSESAPNPGARIFFSSGSVCLYAAKTGAARTRRSLRLPPSRFALWRDTLARLRGFDLRSDYFRGMDIRVS